MTRFSRAVRRTGLVSAVALTLAVLPAAAVAQAADNGQVEQVNPTFVANTNSAASITFTLSSAPSSPAALLNVTLTGPAGAPIGETGNPTVSGSTVTATFNLSAVAPGLYDVRVADPSGSVDDYTCADCLRVLATPPTVTGVSHTTRGAGSPAASFTVSGTNLFEGVSVRFLRNGAADAQITYPSTGSLTVASGNRTVTGDLAVASGAQPGPRDIEVKNTDGQTALCASCLTIVAAPAFSSLSPAVAGQNARSRVLTLLGSDFQPTLKVDFFAPSSPTDKGGVTVKSVDVSGTDVATVVIDVGELGDTANVSRDIVLTNVGDNGTTRVGGALTITPEPSVSGLNPSTLDGSATEENVTVTGTGLTAAPVFQFSGTGITVNSYTPSSTNAATGGVLNVSIAPGASTDGRTLTITNPDGGRSTSGTVLTVNGTPTVSGVRPGSLGRGATNRDITIDGTNFDTANSGANVSVTIPGVTLTNVLATSSTTITAKASVPSNVDAGPRTVSVLNTAGGRRGRASCECFSVDTFSVDSITPGAVLNSASYRLAIGGSGMPAGETLTATLTRTTPRAGQDPIVFTGTVNESGTEFTGVADLRAVAPGGYNVRLSHGDTSGTCECVFSVVNETTPSVTRVTPSSLPQGASNRELTVDGTGFTHGTDVRFGTGVTKAGPVTFVDTRTLRVPVNVAGDAAAGANTVTVGVPAYGADSEASCSACFSVTKRPTVTSASRSSRGQGAPATSITLTGADFQAGAVVTAGDGVGVSDVVRVSATSITFTAAVANDAVPGPRVITVTNPDSGVGTCACFAVTARPLSSSVTPATGGQGRNGVTVTLSGSGFQPGAAVSFGNDIVVTNVTGSGGALTVTLDLRAAQLGAHAVTVTNPDGGVATCTCEFTVHVVPTITGLTPSSRGAGAVGETVTVMGTSFTPGATVAFADPAITVVRTTFVDAFRVDAVVSIAGDATPGTRSVTVTNADTGQSADCAACFTVNPRPTVSPADHTAQRNRKNVVATFSGSGFQPGTIGADLGEGITVDQATATTPTSVTVQFDVGPSASLGKRDVTLVNGDGGRVVCDDCLTITTARAFTISGDASPVSGAAQTVTVTAHVSSDQGSATDTSYTGVPVLFAAGDSHFSGGTCAAAVNGVSTCQNVRFGDLGPAQLNASGTGADDDLGGTRAVTVEPTALTFSPTPPASVRQGSPATFTVRPLAGVSGASIADYAAARTVHLTGHSRPTMALSCASEICTFSVTFGSTGRKTVRVTDDSSPNATTPTATITVSIPTAIPDFRVSRTTLVAGQGVTMKGTLRDADGRPLAGQPVRMYVSGGGLTRWHYWFTATTDSAGVFARRVTMTKTRTIKAVFLPTSATYSRADSRSITVGVATRVRVTSPSSGSTVGRSLVVRGTTYPSAAGTTVALYRRLSDGRLQWLRTSRVGSDGTLALSKTMSRGTYTLQVAVSKTVSNLRGTSPFFSVRVV